MQFSYAQDDTDCVHISQADFENTLKSLTVLNEEQYLNEVKIYTEKYCVKIENVHMISEHFSEDNDRMDYLLFAYHFVEDWSNADEYSYYFEDELNRESFINYVNSFQSEMAEMHQSVNEINNAPVSTNEEWNESVLDEAAKVVYVKDYRGKIGANIPMNTDDYMALKFTLQKQNYDHERIEVYKRIINGKGLSVDQLNGIMRLFSFENDKMKVLNSSLSSIYDLDNLGKIKNNFVNLFHKNEIDKITSNDLVKYTVETIPKDENIVYQQN
ncbi:DUF4476 domain-containing protein [Flammeovirga pacifica]|uniref:DUF4476 domain-containing protein n=1 Tax=Flammeovirga pacifica TaxID=915059 RepID=A0A1S1Z2Q3_FLAPC|nr:DUF4476 domain-containing protein [Flammeovirga pacifica]OHX67550.1 hypothetical protein NH26_14945 [Flammeovirga pacifica]